MRIPSSVFAVVRYALAVTAVAGTLVLMSAPRQAQFTVHDKAYYADSATVNFVRPGLTIKILSASVASDGVVTARYKITDPKGLPLDRDGITTPGAVSVSLILAAIPKNQTQYRAYTTRSQGPSPITRATAIQAGADSGGRHEKVSDGEYLYTFGTKLPSTYDKTITHTVGAYGSRNLTEFDLGTNYASDVYSFVPDGSRVTVTRDVIKNATCNKCHGDLAFHGGSRRGMEICILCHTPATMAGETNLDPDTGNTIDMMTMTHRIHAGAELPSVKAGKKYQIIGNQQAVADYSTVVFPANIRNCTFCHDQSTNAAQKTAFLTPTRAACGSCHDNVNFATGAGHVNLPQASDRECASCHIPRGELEFDASIMGAHTIATQSSSAPGLVVSIVKVENGTKGRRPTVTFTLRDAKNNGIPIASMKTSPNRVYLVLAGPTIDYGYTSFGSDVTTSGYVSEDASGATCDAGGTCVYTFNHAIPADAWGTYAIGIEARRGHVINPGTKREVSTQYGAINKVAYFSVDGSAVSARRQVVDIKKCNNCHSFLSLHGENRNQIEQCVLCHNPGETDKARRPSATNAADKAAPPQSVNFALMIHKIHTGEGMAEYNAGYTVVGYGGSHNDFGEVRYPAMTVQGRVGAQGTRNCSMCHVNGSEQKLPTGLNLVTDPQGRMNPAPAVTSACTSCHLSQAAMAHASTNIDPKFGESCAVCHGSGADFNVNKVHAQ